MAKADSSIAKRFALVVISMTAALVFRRKRVRRNVNPATKRL
jgi:hypothetical protein